MAKRYYPSLGKDVVHPAAATAIRQAFDHLYDLMDQVKGLQDQREVVKPLNADQISQITPLIPTVPTTLVRTVTTLPPPALSTDGEMVQFNHQMYWYEAMTQTWHLFA